MGMAGRYLYRLVGAKKKLLLLNKSSSSAAAFSPRRPENHLIRLLGTTTTTTNTTSTTIYGFMSGIVEGNLSTRAAAMSTTAPTLGGVLSSELKTVLYCVDDFDIYSQYYDIDDQLLEEVLPVMGRTLRSAEWSLLQRYCSKDRVDIKVALDNELAAMCVWFFYIDVPTVVKEGVAWTLMDICSKTSEGTSEESVIRDAPSFVSSFDQESVNALLVDALSSKNEEVLRQVCSILGFVAGCRCYQAISFGDAIQYKLIQLSRNFSYDSPVLPRILFAINRISWFSKGMKEKFIEAELSDGFLRRILRREGHHNSSLELQAYYMVDIIAYGQCNDELWKYLKEHLMSAVIDRCFLFNIRVMRSGADLISSFITQASPSCLKELVDLGVLETLIRLLKSDDASIKGDCFEAVETILSFGDADPSKNEYAKMIDDLTTDWQVFYVNRRGSNMVKMYRPDKYLAA